MVDFILYETASGYSLFQRSQSDDIPMTLEAVQKDVSDLSKFGKCVQLKSFLPFKSAVEALENANDVSEGICSDTLKEFLKLNLPKSLKGVSLGISDKNLAGSVKATVNVECVSNEMVAELIRGIRFHGAKLLKQLSHTDMEKAQLGLGHSYSRAKVKFNVHRSDNMIIQSIALLDQMDKDVNNFTMRLREWYSWHFPELSKLVKDNIEYSRLVTFIKSKGRLGDSDLQGLTEITDDEAKSQQILDAARASMGTELSEIDILNITSFSRRVADSLAFRKSLHEYLISKMNSVAPNLAALIGETVGARLISHAGSLTNLSKYPASTVQILGAEKALFRALKTKGKTPKYGLIFNSSFISRAATKNKGRISRFLANKCTLASRIDCFTDKPTSVFGEALKRQVENRLEFYESGAAPLKNVDTMQGAIVEWDKEEDANPIPEAPLAKESSKKDKKSKKEKKEAKVAPKREAEAEVESTKPDKKKKKKNKDKKSE
ncbi:Nucleolar protein 56 [Entomophthora muscae]|uniref:Nucleolar protein 56 n=2 Tax=Entomophthora muscae TaxID=34485 RepID=A0ACC2S555_9FUNG|nr:Nucleolar protein 56 [Entomophthora muscae]